MALNMWKMSTSISKISPNTKNKKTIRIFQKFEWSSYYAETYVTASCTGHPYQLTDTQKYLLFTQ